MSYKRNFKLSDGEYVIVNTASDMYKYEVLFFNDKKKYWEKLFYCNTLREGYEKAYQLLLDTDEYNKKQREYNENYQKYIQELDSKKMYCKACNKELTIQEKIDECEECLSCIMKLYNTI